MLLNATVEIWLGSVQFLFLYVHAELDLVSVPTLPLFIILLLFLRERELVLPLTVLSTRILLLWLVFSWQLSVAPHQVLNRVLILHHYLTARFVWRHSLRLNFLTIIQVPLHMRRCLRWLIAGKWIRLEKFLAILIDFLGGVGLRDRWPLLGCTFNQSVRVYVDDVIVEVRCIVTL